MKIATRFLLIASLLFSACGGTTDDAGGETEASDEAYYYTYKTAEFELQVPDDWNVVDAFDPEYPEDLRVAFKNNETDSIFTANVTVLREENTKSDTSYDYAQRKLADHEENLLNYKLLEQEVVNLQVNGAESKTMLTTFEGKNDASSPTLDFMQVTLCDGEKAWTVTATYREGTDGLTLEQLTTMLTSFSLR